MGKIQNFYVATGCRSINNEFYVAVFSVVSVCRGYLW